jgi:hypothetical protein
MASRATFDSLLNCATDFGGQTREIVAMWFRASITKTLQVAYPIHVPHVLNICPVGPQPRWQHEPLCYVLTPPDVPRY